MGAIAKVLKGDEFGFIKFQERAKAERLMVNLVIHIVCFYNNTGMLFHLLKFLEMRNELSRLIDAQEQDGYAPLHIACA